MKFLYTHFYRISRIAFKTTFNNGILLNSVSIPKLLNNPFASCSFTNIEFLNLHLAHFDCIINLPCVVLKIFEFIFTNVPCEFTY